MVTYRRYLGIVAAALSLLAMNAFAHTDSKQAKAKPKQDYAKAAEMPFGKAADPRKARRTIQVDMADTMRFTPPVLTIKRGDTVRFVVTNSGKLMHEMVLGTMKELKEHAELMKKMPGMEHDEPYMVHVEPGRKEEMGWQFTKAGEFYYGCLVPGHFEAGMLGKVVVK
jgi:uncharacterized cupredoxin-like copper-binding protein